MGNQADVRVRLSAEGQAEVIAAFQKIASEGKKTGTETAAGFNELNNKLKDVAKTLTGGLGMILIAEKFKEFFKSTLEGSENLTRLSKQTGLSTNLIQGFGRAARETGVDQEVANNALAKFTVNVGKAGIGSKASATALSDLGISVRDFSKLKPDAQFQLVAERLAAIPDPARRARDEVALFSRAGVQLDQALVNVGKEGLEPFIQHMKDLGVFLDTASIASIRGAAESFKNLGDTVKGLATEFLTGLVPGIAAATDELTRATHSEGVSGLKTAGEAIGKVFRGVVVVFEIIGHRIAGIAAQTVTYFQGVGELIAAIPKGFDAVAAAAAATGAKIDAIRAATAESDRDAINRFTADPAKPKPVEGGGEGGEGAAGATAAALAKARLALLEGRLTNELALYNAHAVLVKEADKQAYEDGQISLTEYYARRAALLSGEFDKEIAMLKAKRAAVAGAAVDMNDPAGEINKKTALAKLDTEIQVAEIKRAGELAANTNEQANAQRKLYEDTLKAEEALLTIEGKKVEAARLKLALDIADLDAKLRKGGVSDTDRAGAEATAAGQGGAQIDFSAASAKAQADLAALTSAEKGFATQVRDGQLFSISAAGQVVAKQKEMLPVLQADAAAMLKLAQATGNALDVEKAQAYKDKIDQIAASTNLLGIQMAQLKQGAESAIGDGLTKFLSDAVSGTKTLKQAFTDMALSMIQDIEKIIIKLMVEDALKAMFATASGGGLASSGSGASAPTPGYSAGGGQIKGPGTSTSDSIPTMLSNNEFVVNAKAVTTPGILPLLTAINNGALKAPNAPSAVPKFAAGGQVGGSSGAPVIKLVNVLDPTTLGDHLETSAGEKSVLNIISRNGQRVRSSLA
jgi:hypothetical protein